MNTPRVSMWHDGNTRGSQGQTSSAEPAAQAVAAELPGAPAAQNCREDVWTSVLRARKVSRRGTLGVAHWTRRTKAGEKPAGPSRPLWSGHKLCTEALSPDAFQKRPSGSRVSQGGLPVTFCCGVLVFTFTVQARKPLFFIGNPPLPCG